MPSANNSKRSRRAAFADDGGDEDGATIAEASSSLRNESQRKKPRTSDAGPSKKSARPAREQNTVSSDEDEVMQEPDAPPSPPAATQYEIMRDAGFKFLEHTDLDDQRATQRFQTRPEMVGENHAALNAILESITCYNFMCHTRLHCELGPLLNFIVGENGSGKSAILTAITLCLGGKASATNRGGSLRSFVKEGQEHASLVVKLKNQGPDAYKPEHFGESIVVERHFTKSGSSGFKLKSVTGRIISTKKSDVDDVVEYYCLQVDNPLNVLSQDNARQFLNAASPAAKYKYFVQGTQLEQLDHDYQLLQETLEANETKLLAFQENIHVLGEKCEKAVKLRDAVTKSAEMRNQSKVYSNQLAWAQVMEQENILQQKDDAIGAAQEEITQWEQTIEEKTQILSSIDDRIEQAKQNLESFTQEEIQAKEQEGEAKSKFDEGKKAIEETHTQERDLHQQLTNASDKVEEYRNLIQEEEQRLEQMNGGALAETQKKLDEAKQAVKDIEEARKAHDARLPTLTRDCAEADRQVQELNEKLDRQKKEVTATETRIRNLSQDRIDPLAGYEPQIPQLLKLVENDNGFREKPIGPIGSHIRLAKVHWLPVIETTIGRNLSAFIVTSKADQQRLSGHMDRLRLRNCPILIGSHGSINRLNEPDEKFDTILRVLKFDNQLVRDQLVITASIEQTLLIEKREDAEVVMFDGSPPQNVAACLSHHDKKRGHGLRMTRRGNTNFTTTPVTPSHDQRFPRIQSDKADEIKFHQDALEQLRTELRGLDASRRVLQQAAHRCAQAVTQHQRQVQAFAKDSRNADVRARTVQEALDAFDGIDVRLQGLKTELEEAARQKDVYGNQYGEMAVQKQNMNKEVESLKKTLSQAKLASQECGTKVAKAEDKVKRYQETRRVAVVEKNQAHEQLDLTKAKKSRAEESRERQAAVVADYTQQAGAVAPERAYIPEGQTVQSIERKFESIREQLRKIRSQLGASEEEINNRAAQASQEYRDAKRHYKSLVSLADELKNALMDRLEKWRTFLRLISAHARTNFGYLLSERGFRGKLLLDHKAKKLQIQVEPDETKKTGAGRNTKTLSGGEKSFSSICLLLAIWDAMGSPLRCLDEFDVFMDNVNRAISTNMLITTARRSVGKQFILITPNAIEGSRANLDKDVKIIRLTDPRQQLLADH
ncbi:P-loop containing nucleoside triphosphate hydrolase protein [Whalleya microplaca]|nr:P-loop containing nucleoside triphosphate hydrolase protein [Whalleya microplaca]